MANYIICLLIFRIILPVVICTSIIFRPTFISAVYFLFLLCLPLVPVPTRLSLAGVTGIYLKILIAVSVLTAAGQLAFQIVLLSLPPYGHFLTNCEFLEKILRHTGLVKLNAAGVDAIVTWLSPEVVMVVASIATYILCNKLSMGRVVEETEEACNLPKKANAGKRNFNILVILGKYATLVALCVAAILRPSIPGAVYFMVFLSSATWWACYKELRKGFAIMMRCLMVLVAAHMGVLYAYQFQWPQEYLDKNSTYARYFGLTPLVYVNCGDNSTNEDPRNFRWAVENEWPTFVNPIALFFLYYILALESKWLFKPQLIRGVSPSSKRYGSGKKPRSILQDSTGSVTITGDHPDDIPMDQLEEEYQPTLCDNVILAMETLLQFIIRSSYIGTNIIMMAWSITYLSWITFVLLLWANLLWLVPNQRKSMLRSSPFLVIYAWFLLISAYIYSMNLTEEELPTSVQGINLSEIGFVKVENYACLPLFVKCLFTGMFWITLRQYMQERIAERQSNTLADMVAPLQVTMGAATGVKDDQEPGSKVMERFGQLLKKFLTRFWIWMVAITLFAVAITGQKMTCFRILYMALFLFFVLCFQLSFRIWRKIMFGFWLTVIICSMIILVMVYTYQFDKFSTYWEEYLHVPEKQQHDIGLEKFDTKDLFVRLVTPTFFVIIAVIQLHYFHKDFMTLSDPKDTNIIAMDLDESSLQGATASERDETNSSLKPSSTHTGSERGQKWIRKLQNIINLIYVFLELHLPKLVLLFLMFVCVYDNCALYLICVFLIVLALTTGRPILVACIFCSSVFVCLMLLGRMIYQIQYIEPGTWNVTCELNGTEHITNNAHWFGFVKTDDLPYTVQWNIIYIMMVTLWSVVTVRQYNYRVSRGRPTTRAFFMFPHITRAEADRDLRTMIKYLFNYGFYKFGVEISFLATVALIGFRMDSVAFIYSIWLCVLFNMSRQNLSRIWNFYMTFIAILMVIQYAVVVGLPPTLCTLYPWDELFWEEVNKSRLDFWRRVQDWAYLTDTQFPPPAPKLICDFILLLFVARQSVVFRIERRNAGRNYVGGSNESIIHHAEEKGFVNPVPDYITYVRSYLDIFKRGLLNSFLWITLAIVFLAGTNRVNVFSIGYLCGAFIFLWQGTDLYLRPIPKILRSWNWLIGYNVFVILVKTGLQIVGCVFINDITEATCWSIQLFGIGCVRKFSGIPIDPGTDDTNQCKVPREFVGLVWDGLCFGFLIIQKRIFQSYNFFHMIDENKAATILASRGAELIEELRQKRMTDQEEQERQVLEKIKTKMDRIKASQKKIQGTSYHDSTSHYVDTIYKGRPKHRRGQPKSYKEAIRSGDYYMFDDLDDDDEGIDFEEDPKQVDDGEEDDYEKNKKPTMSQIDEQAPKSVTIVEDRSKDEPPSEPQPGTSKDADISELEQPKYTLCQKIWNLLLFAWAFIESSLISATNFLNRYSRDYRYVLRVLTKEKKILKENTNYNVGLRMGSAQVWQPSGSYHSLLRQSREEGSHSRLEMEECEGTEMSSYDQPTVIRFLLAVWYIIMSHSEVACYFMIFLNQIKSATFLSLPLPLMVFLWGTLTIPRPSKNFWVTIIAYTEVIVLIKCMFQFDIISWNQQAKINSNPFYPPRIIGIERNKNYAVWDLLLLLVVFFHRFMLKSMGLWKTSAIPAALLSEGDYRITSEGRLVPIDKKKSSSSGSVDAKGSPTRKDSDLQRLVEETDEEERKEDFDLASFKDGDLDNKIVTVQSDLVEPLDHLPQALQMATSKYTESFKIFFKQLLDPTSRVAADVYSYMFMCDFYNFFVILIGYSSFGTQQGDGGVSSYLEDNRVPVLFLLMLILQFTLIIVDRGIFLRKNILAKIMFQFIQVFILHVWLFIIFPVITERGFNSVLPPQMYYMVKCFYLLLSAYQIRCGYPTRILGNFLCKGYNYVNMFLFKGFMAIPFLFELRTVMDWMWTDTSMTVFDWIKMEDIFAHIFQLKCTRHVEDEYPQPRGERKNPVVKYAMGGFILLFIIAIIWFPLVFFSLGNAVGEANPPYDVTLELRIGPYEPVYQISAQSNSIYTFTESNLQSLKQVYADQKSAITFISNYEAEDIAAVKLSSFSATIWSISPPDRKRMVDEVNSTKSLLVRLEYKVSHKTSKPEDSGVIPDHVEVSMEAGSPEAPNVARQNLLRMLESDAGTPSVNLKTILPKFLKVTNRGTAKAMSQLMFSSVEEERSFRNVSLTLDRSANQTVKEWWKIQESCNDKNYEKYLKDLPYQDCSSIILYTFNDKIFPSTLSFFTAGGIVGLYTTLVFVASRLLRGFFAEQCFKIMFEDMPYIDRVLQLCLDIYLVREAREFALEEDLFAKLVFLFRSPETMIKWTRPKEEVADDEDPEGDA